MFMESLYDKFEETCTVRTCVQKHIGQSILFPGSGKAIYVVEF